MPSYLTVTFEYECAEDVIEGFPGVSATSHTCEPVSNTPPVVLSGLVKGGEIRTVEEWLRMPRAVVSVGANGCAVLPRWSFNEAVARGALPITWYRYEEP